MHVLILWLGRSFLTVAAAGLLSSLVFVVLATLGGLHFRRQRIATQSFLPPISVLKPVHGREEALQENLRTFFRQDYPEFEVIFCARSLDDPAIVCAQELAGEYPQIPVRFIASGEPVWTNPKVYSMALLAEAAAHETVLFSDSDVRVGRDYLRSVVQPLRDPQVGLVTCVFRGRPLRGIWSKLTALNQSVEFSSGVLTANFLEGTTFGLGPTLLTRKSNLAEIGGLESMSDLLADDFWMGHRLIEKGKTVILSHYVVDHHLHYESLRSSFRHQLGWMKNTRRSRPAGHFGSGLTYAMPYGLLGALGCLMLHHATGAVVCLLLACVNRWIQALFSAYFLDDFLVRRLFWLNPVSDLFGFSTWLASYTGDVIDFRGEKYRIARGGQIVRTAGPRVQNS